MKRGLWLNVALLATVAALALFAYLKPHPGEPRFKLSTLKAADATSIKLEVAGTAPITLERAGSGWRLAAPVAAR
ncbi:MAG: hypothetical protein HYU73_28400, partial [Betaproteobacteria bacterium]|nr:hypothetical protein [Betaproteobacteria bacterium]